MIKLIGFIILILFSGCVANFQKCDHPKDKNDPFSTPKRNIYTFFYGNDVLKCERITLLTTTDVYYLCTKGGI